MNRERTEVIREKDRRDAVSATAREEANRGDTRTDPGLLPYWTFGEYCCECAGTMDVILFEATVVDGRSLEIYNRNHFWHDTALGARLRRWAVLRQSCVGIPVDVRIADMPFVWCGQMLFY